MRQCLRLQLSSIRLTRTLLSFWWKSVFLTCCIIVHTGTRQHGKTFCKQLQEFGLWLTAVKIPIWKWTEQKWINKQRTTGWNKRYRHRNRKLCVLACTAGMHHSVSVFDLLCVCPHEHRDVVITAKLLHWIWLFQLFNNYSWFFISMFVGNIHESPSFLLLLEYKVLTLISFTNTFLYWSKIFTQLQKYKWNWLLAVKFSTTHTPGAVR